nr:hypothetical protein [Candidatus Sigynarchaeota archaeon]
MHPRNKEVLRAEVSPLASTKREVLGHVTISALSRVGLMNFLTNHASSSLLSTNFMDW